MVLPLALVPIVVGLMMTINHYTKPRLPVYIMTPVLTTVPRIRTVIDEWKLEVVMKVNFCNDNYIHLDMYALHFDLLAVAVTAGAAPKTKTVSPTGVPPVPITNTADTYNKAYHLASITDEQQSKISLEKYKFQQQVASRKNANTTTTTTTIVIKQQQQNLTSKSDIIWSINGRSNFTSYTKLHIRVSLWETIKVLPSILYRWLYYNNGITLPTTGAVHMKVRSGASPGAPPVPITVSLICDNIMNTYTLQIMGLYCTLYNVNPGHTNLSHAASKVRHHVLSKSFTGTSSNITGSILQPKNWDELVQHANWG